MRCTFLSALALFFNLVWIGNAAPAQTNRPAPASPSGEVSRQDKVGGKNFDEWKKELSDSDPAVVENAIRTIPLYGRALAREAVPILVRKLKVANLDISVKVCTAIFLGNIGLDGDELDQGVTGLTHLLSNEQVIVKLYATLALAQIGQDAKEATPALLSNLSHFSWEIRMATARALASVARPRDEKTAASSQVIGQLRRHLRYRLSQTPEPCAQVRKEVAMALVALGPPGPATERKLVEDALASVASKDRDKTVQIWAHVGVMRMSKVDPKRLDKIGEFLTDSVLMVRCEAARVLGLIGPDAKSQVRRLVSALDDKDALMQGQVIMTLGEMGNAASSAVEKLEAFAKDTKNPGLKAAAEAAVKVIKKPPERKPR
jgi:hypothetical protein